MLRNPNLLYKSFHECKDYSIYFTPCFGGNGVSLDNCSPKTKAKGLYFLSRVLSKTKRTIQLMIAEPPGTRTVCRVV